ncbi:wall-associated receptor kinase 2-like [Benincasa hispida]|uniref:wall-associated receptor kinase 2-like n=1 Tax=Benincasa hispida TaxID=102211 RepID=UPI001901F236|nr:wall-associated receptor kinase 2-like [Benincasa hispida]
MRSATENLIKLIILLSATLAAAAPEAAKGLTGCDERCGDLKIPYPFGIKKGCYLDEDFSITCNKSHDPPKAFLKDSNTDITNISIIQGQLHILQFVAKDCYTKDGPSEAYTPTLELYDLTISNTDNKFIVIGCDTYAFISGEIEGQSYKSGCMALCGNSTKTIKDGSCSGNGCCQLEIPKGLKYLELDVRSFNNHSEVLEFNSCGYAFVVQQDKFTFSEKYIHNFTQEEVPLVLDWAIPANTSCLKAGNKTNCSICGTNTKTISFLDDGSNYRCQCLEGFEGNPYLPQGCQDIDECKNGSHKCTYKDLCVNTQGNYTCYCPKNHEGDGRYGGEGCTPNSRSSIHIIIGICVGFAVLVIGSVWLYLGYKKWKFIQQKEKFFKKNGGLMLQKHLSEWQSPDMLKIFTQEKLEKATNKYDDSAMIGKGGFGTVYKGVLDDGSTVAIKKSKLVNQSQTNQFINEVIVLSQINHRNVVKLIGCCLETKVPLLVYEFVNNRTLFEHIHRRTNQAYLPWEARLKIASEIASVLSYLHSSTSTPIIHRDIKSNNILLDQNYTAKVSDFGMSKLVPLDGTQISTMVQGTIGYLDPEYYLTSELTEKSDVYSFGIVLMELITGKKAVCFDGPEEERSLAMYVLYAMEEDRVEEVVEKGMPTEKNFEQIKKVAELGRECVRVKKEERPSMKEVAMKLEVLRQMQQVEFYSWGRDNLLDGVSNSSQLVTINTNESMDVGDLTLVKDRR